MTPDHARSLLPVITAFADGAEIQYCDTIEGWVDDPCPDFGGRPDFWRVKPKEPREFEIHKDAIGHWVVQTRGNQRIGEVIRAREIL